VYGNTLVTKFVNTVMKAGKRSTAEAIIYRAFDIIKEKTGDDPIKVFKKAVDNVKPTLEVKSRRVGGSNYQVPIEVNPNRRLSLSIRWLVQYSRSRGDGKTMHEKLANEFMGRGEPARRGGQEEGRHPPHAEANKAFAHFAGKRKTRQFVCPGPPTRSDAEHRHHGPHRCREDDDDRAASCSTPASPTSWVRSTRGPR